RTIPNIKLTQQITQTITNKINTQPTQTHTTITLLNKNTNIPFITHYHKKITNNLNITQLHNLKTHLTYLHKLKNHHTTILSNINKQNKLTNNL
ncbi:RNA-binding transcriptional accessory protein, partial [Xanthomonas citri pv. citri]|nr:RNA-binding transcriptional accessory protein [Xanthomonas citri pv. citri]